MELFGLECEACEEFLINAGGLKSPVTSLCVLPNAGFFSPAYIKAK
jgi:hypothetical protein